MSSLSFNSIAFSASFFTSLASSTLRLPPSYEGEFADRDSEIRVTFRIVRLEPDCDPGQLFSLDAALLLLGAILRSVLLSASAREVSTWLLVIGRLRVYGAVGRQRRV